MTADAQPPASGNPVGRIALGLALLAPAAACCALQFAIPTLRTALTSLQGGTLLRAGDFVGFENYLFLFDERMFGAALRFTLLVLRIFLGHFVGLQNLIS